MFVFIQKEYRESFVFLILVFELFTDKVCETFVCKHTEAVEYVKKSSLPFKKNAKFTGV